MKPYLPISSTLLYRPTLFYISYKLSVTLSCPRTLPLLTSQHSGPQQLLSTLLLKVCQICSCFRSTINPITSHLRQIAIATSLVYYQGYLPLQSIVFALPGLHLSGFTFVNVNFVKVTFVRVTFVIKTNVIMPFPCSRTFSVSPLPTC